MNLLETAKIWLQNNSIIVPDDWLQACVEWIREENRDQPLGQDAVNSQVYEQWLLSDLHELETSCLPADVTSEKFELNGSYALQIDSVVDVGVSFYSQSQKLQGTENPNIHVTADEPTQKPWEQKPSRMLMLKLTDGHTSVQGMEYRPISALSPQTPPGAKILVQGPVLCRHGILMLLEGNVKFLGGEVDTLVEANTLINVLQSAMETSSENAGKEHSQTFPGSEVRKNKTGDSFNAGCGQSQLGTQQGRKFGNQSSNFGNQSSHVGNQTRNFGNQSSNFGNQSGNRGTQSGFVKKEVKNEPIKGQLQSTREQNIPDLEISDDMFMDEMEMDDDFMQQLDEDMDFQDPPAVPNSRNPPSVGGMAVPTASLPPAKQNLAVPVNHPPRNGNVGVSKLGSSSARGNTCFTSSDKRNSNNLTAQVKIEHFNEDCDHDFSNGNICQNSSTSSNMCNTVASRNGSAQKTPSLSTVVMTKGNSSVVDTDIRNSLNSLPTPRAENVSLSGKRLSGDKSFENGSSIKRQNIVNALKPEKTVSEGGIRSLSMSSNDLSPAPLSHIDAEYPFTYLNKVLGQPPSEEPSYHTVKAYIATLVSKLRIEGNKWMLTCKINDGTRAIDVDLSNQVLTEMIGFSPQEANEMKKRVKIDRGVKEVLTDGIKQCQQKLIELMCLLELEISASNPRPVVVATKPITSNHINMLYNRVVASIKK
ncbi:recQ-mediated genome instability protein 1-like [Mya arenaria]|uniref:recQ-mediated genome instability protein 1-like n=1 Tax=Mya arenaria TaxID=6604 RepID=UPI0022E74BDC|nr:recQ-mediated genome instability protein 1-like [Mya arenaria]